MAGKKISAATDAVTLNATDKLPIARSASSTAYYVQGSYISTYVLGVLAGGSLALTGTIGASNFSGTSSGTNTGDQTSVSGNAGTATALATARAIYGNNFDGTAPLTQAVGAAFGGTGIINNAASTITISGSFGTTFTVTGTTSVTLPTSGTLTTLSTVVSTANTYTAAQRGAFSTLTDGSTVTPDFSLANNYNLILGGNRTLGVPSNIVAGQTGAISIRQDISGSRTLAYAWVYIFPGGNTPVLSTGKLVLDQLYYCVNHYATATVTMTIATPCVVTWTGHGLVSGQRVQFTNSGGALPTGVTASTTYWITVIDANTFNLSTSLANAQAATFVATSGSQSGTHTGVSCSITISNNLALA